MKTLKVVNNSSEREVTYIAEYNHNFTKYKEQNCIERK